MPVICWTVWKFKEFMRKSVKTRERKFEWPSRNSNFASYSSPNILWHYNPEARDAACAIRASLLKISRIRGRNVAEIHILNPISLSPVFHFTSTMFIHQLTSIHPFHTGLSHRSISIFAENFCANRPEKSCYPGRQSTPHFLTCRLRHIHLRIFL